MHFQENDSLKTECITRGAEVIQVPIDLGCQNSDWYLLMPNCSSSPTHAILVKNM